MSRTELLVIWMVLAAVGFAQQSERNSSSRSKIFPKTFGGSRNHKIHESNSSQNSAHVPASRRGIPGNHPHSWQRNEIVEVKVSDVARQYLTGLGTTVVIPFIYSFVFTASLPLNLLAILVFIFKIGLTKPTAIYMMNLAAADLLFVLLLPLKISYHFSGNDWGFGPFVCRLVTGGFYAYMCSSVLLMTCISVDRYLAVVYPIKSASWRSRRRAAGLCLVAWLLSICSALPLFLTQQSVYVTNLNITTCHDVLTLPVLHTFSLYYFPSLCILFFVIPLVVTTACYMKIISTLRSASAVNPYGKRRAFFLAIIVLCVFLVCFTPTNIVLLIHSLHFSTEPSDTLYFVYMLCVCLGSVSCCFDPLIYYYASSSFQNQLHHLLNSREDESIQVKELINKPGTSTPYL
ncbi:proteinase-activated receptor 1-like [Amblyraja radiata]|uniref:proteinase-activated receptor 1-like n=1 Tax=Amblyraja radiata TaxID=386614 RepID=UPI0014038159|nr:proteinase-activated receptor 1-like [Amblyraja radiata]